MQKRLIHLLILTLALIFGSAATALAGLGHAQGEPIQRKSSYFIDHKTLEQAGLVHGTI
jgi:hypothetical protein